MKAIVVTLLLITGISPTPPDPAVVSCRTPITDECSNDDDCTGGLKCCLNPCGRICDLVQPKPGMCPSSRPPPFCRRRSDECDNDRDCPLFLKCCQLGCSNRCTDVAIIPVQKPGICPTPPPIGLCDFAPITDDCSNDDDCTGELKCCQAACGRRCDLVVPKPGTCPSSRPPPFCRRRSDECDNDRDCIIFQKCCQLGCSKRCSDVAIITVQKPGICPTPPILALSDCFAPKTFDCSNDDDCTGELKCCLNPCGRRCDLVIPKPGACPSIRPPPFCRRRSDECDNDRDCPLFQKCCQLGCSNRCTDVAIIPVQKPGFCPILPDLALISCILPITNTCSNDGECRGDLICCPNPCGNRCGLVRPKPGVCPRFVPARRPCNKFDECRNDRDCLLTQKCCRQGCGNRCQSVSRPGRVCPKDVRVVNCYADPCMQATCPSHPNARCVSNYCGGCNADFYENGILVSC